MHTFITSNGSLLAKAHIHTTQFSSHPPMITSFSLQSIHTTALNLTSPCELSKSHKTLLKPSNISSTS